jgi:hypothetical protein
MRNWPDTVISQYSSSPILCGLLEQLDQSIDPQDRLQDFYDKIWNILTAEGYGLDVWGRIVGVTRVLQVTVGSYFGFGEAAPSTDDFGTGGGSPFYTGQALTSNYALSDNAYRNLILAKAAANLTDGSIKSINKILMALFPNRGNAYVTDGSNVPANGTSFGFQEGSWQPFGQAPFGEAAFFSASAMTMIYVFNFKLTPVEIAIVTQSGVLPRSTGVSATYAYQT